MSFLVDALDACPSPVSYAILGLAVFAESVLLVGAFVPTLTLMLAAGALSRTGHLELAPVVIVAATAVVLSDFAALTTGRRLGTRLRTNRIGARVPAAAWARTEQILRRRPGSAVLLAGSFRWHARWFRTWPAPADCDTGRSLPTAPSPRSTGQPSRPPRGTPPGDCSDWPAPPTRESSSLLC